MKRQAITPTMKIDCLLHRYEVWCAICGLSVGPCEEIEWDHVQALVHGGEHVYSNLRPVHALCHLEKTKRDIQANAKVKRLCGETCTRPSRKIPSRPFPRKPVARGA